MLWAQRVTTSVQSICAPTAFCGKVRAARSLRQRSPSCSGLSQGACPSALHLGLSYRDTTLAPHRNGDGLLNMVRPANSDQDADSLGQDHFNTTDPVDPAQAPYRVVNFYHLVDIQNPYQVSYISRCLSTSVVCPFCTIRKCLFALEFDSFNLHTFATSSVCPIQLEFAGNC